MISTLCHELVLSWVLNAAANTIESWDGVVTLEATSMVHPAWVPSVMGCTWSLYLGQEYARRAARLHAL